MKSHVLERRIEPEWLDELPSHDPRAVRSRRDLRVLNRIMGHAGILRGVLAPRMRRANFRIAEIGAGDGTLLLRICAGVTTGSPTEIALVDREPAVSADTLARYRALNCEIAVAASDVFDWLAGETRTYDAIVANLFLHHFDARDLEMLFALARARTDCFVACEPRRARFALAGSRMLGLIGCNDVTRHDAVLSVRAGFSGRELSRLWPATEGWMLDERRAGLFSHVFTAYRSELTAHA